jgi:hypothetical protein
MVANGQGAVDVALDREARLRFLQIDGETRAVLAEFRPALERSLPGIVADFYRHLGDWPNLIAMFDSPSGLKRAQEGQIRHWMHLFSGDFGEDYFRSAIRIGLAHSRIGLDVRWYVGGYSFMMGRLSELVASSFRSRLHPERAARKVAATVRALNQAIMLDMDLVISTYLSDTQARHRAELNLLADAFDGSVKTVANGVAAASTELEASASGLTASAEQTSRRTLAAAGASEQAAHSVQGVAAAAEELAASIAEIGRQVGEST